MTMRQNPTSLTNPHTFGVSLGHYALATLLMSCFTRHMAWNLSETDYPQIDINDNHVAGMALWLEKIAELAPAHEGAWNVLIADLWPNDKMSRLIGHVQMDDVAVGYDTGYRVCAYIKGGGIVGDSGDDKPLIKKWLTEAATRPQTQRILTERHQANPFEIRLTSWGENPISAAIKIMF